MVGYEPVYIDGKEFEVRDVFKSSNIYCYDSHIMRKSYGVFLDAETLFTTKVEEVFINGKPSQLFYDGPEGCYIKPQRYMKDLRKAVESQQLETAGIQMGKTFPKISNTIQSVLEAIPYLGKRQLAMSNGGYGDSKPIFCYVAIVLNKDGRLVMKSFREEDTATRKTQEAVEFIYGKTMQSKIKAATKELSPENKQEFEQEVEAMEKNLDISNLQERVSYLEELYDVMLG